MTSPYEFRVEGHLDQRWTAVLDGFTLCQHQDGTTTLTGMVVDQSHLHGLLARLRDVGAPMLSVQAKPPPDLPTPPDEPLTRVAWPQRTDRLVLRPATPADAEPTWQIRRLASVSHWLTEVPTSFESYRDSFEQPTRLATTIVILLDDRIIGDLMLRVEDAWAQNEVAQLAQQTQAELAWVLAPDFAGQGYATEATTALLGVCFDGLGLRRVVATCFADNVPSWRLMERIGMRREAHAIADALHRTGVWLDTFTYAATAKA